MTKNKLTNKQKKRLKELYLTTSMSARQLALFFDLPIISAESFIYKNKIKKPFGLDSRIKHGGQTNFMKSFKDGKECALCFAQNDLQIHHKDENRKNNQMSNLIILCRSCHSKQHRGKEWGKNMKKTQDFSTRKRRKDGKFK